MKNFKFAKFKSVSLSVYFVILVSIIIFFTTTVFSVFILLTVKDIPSKYENEIGQLRNSISTILIQSFNIDIQRDNFESTESIISLLKQFNMLSYIYILDSSTGKVISDDKTVTDRASMQIAREQMQSSGIQKMSHTAGNYVMYYAIPQKNYMNVYYDGLAGMVAYVLTFFVFFAVVASVMLSRIISDPLKKLSDAAAEIANGNFDVTIKTTNFTEIDNLISSYSNMEFQLKELYSSLELKVQERTIALEEANYKLKETQAMMVHSEKMRSLGELVAGIAHEINNPVNFIHGNIMILQNYADDMLKLIDLYDKYSSAIPQNEKTEIDDLRNEIDLEFLRDDIKELIRSCVEGTQRTKNIVLDLKNFSRMEEMVLTQFDIPKEIDTTLNILNNKYKNRITVVKNYDDSVPKIEAYGGQLNQVFMNILDNAQDAMAETGTLTINISQIEDKVKIEFIDTGAGIPEENLKKVFDPFFTTKPVGKGTGLGMSISYRVINDHNGTIEVESELGKGTKFTITLPINQPGKEEQLMSEEA